MRQLETVSIEDVYPWEDEYGNAILSRDYTAKANREYVAELARSMRAKGEPDEPPVLARDGGIFRIVAGNSRVQAMRELGTKRFAAVVLDMADAKAAVEVAVRTDVKKKYEAEEGSRLVQQLLMFGDDAYVGEVAGIGADEARRIRRGHAKVGDAAEDMSLDRLMAIAEFEDDVEAVAELTDCREADWQGIATRLRRVRERRERDALIEAKLTLAAIDVVDVRPQGTEWVAWVSDPDRMDEDDLTRATMAVHNENGGFMLVRWPDEEDDEAAREEARQREERETQKVYDREVADRCRERRREWFARKLASTGVAGMPSVSAYVLELRDSDWDREAMGWLRGQGVVVTVGTVDVAKALHEIDRMEFGPWRYGWQGEGARQIATGGQADKWRALYECMVKDGYEMDEDERAMLDALNGEE